MAVTAALVKELRERTGAGMMECKKALVETGGDLEGAIEFLRKSGLAQADKKAGRIAAEGKIALDDQDMTAMLAGGAAWALDRGWGRAEDLDRIEERGRCEGADPAAVAAARSPDGRLAQQAGAALRTGGRAVLPGRCCAAACAA